MKRIVLASFFLFLAAYTFAAKGYAITQKFKGASNADVTVTWYVTDDKCKMKMVFGIEGKQSTAWFIPDLATGQLLTYNEANVAPGKEKTYTAIPLSSITGTVANVAVHKTDEAKDFGGLACDEYVVQSGTTETEVWVSKKFSPAFYKYYAFFKDYVALTGLNQQRVKGFPMQAVTKDTAGKEVNGYYFVSAQEVELSDADFKVPAEYKAPSGN